MLALLLACASPAPAPGSVLLEGAPHVVQRPDFCGEACVEMALARLGYTVDQDAVFDAAGVDPALGRGLVARELYATLLAFGFAVGDTWYPLPVAPQWDALLADLHAGVPSIVCLTTEGGGEHFVLVLGYDAGTDELVVHDPGDVDGAHARLPRSRFLARWPLGGHTLVRLRLEPMAPLTLPTPADGVTPADLAQAVRRVRAVAPEGATIVVEPPFVVVGTEPAATVEARAEGTVRRSVALLRADYFPTATLDRPWEIWLFGDERTYYRETERIFGARPNTPYGFADGNHHALVMNIATGGGTLVHELVHPWLAADFPEVPSWFNEGLASLYEMSGEVDGHLWGYPNWRLPGLQAAIRAGEVPDFRTFTAQSPRQFYGPHSGRNYAQARYLCLYLQEKGLLRRYYHLFRDSLDLTGYAPLVEVLGHPDMAAFQAEWERFVLGLRYER